LCDFLETHLGGNFDLVTKQGLSPYIGKHILREVQYVPIASRSSQTHPG
jgi:predicted nucleotidyltransferase